MGDDGTGFTDGYLVGGDVVRFKVWQASSGTFYDAITEVAPVDCFAPADDCDDIDPAPVSYTHLTLPTICSV